MLHAQAASDFAYHRFKNKNLKPLPLRVWKLVIVKAFFTSSTTSIVASRCNNDGEWVFQFSTCVLRAPRREPPRFSRPRLVVAVSVVVLEEHTGSTTFSLYPVSEFIWNRNKWSNPTICSTSTRWKPQDLRKFCC